MTSRSAARLGLLILPSLVALFATASTVRAESTGTNTQCLFASPVYEAVWHPGNVGETMSIAVSQAAVVAKDAQLRPSGWHIKEIHTSVYICNTKLDSVDFDVLWRKEPGVDDTWVVGWGWTDFFNHNNSLRNSGYRLTFADSYVINGQVFVSGVWRKSSASQVDDLGWSAADFANRVQQMSTAGWEAVFVDAYLNDSDATFYNVSWRPKTVANQTVVGWAPQDFDRQYSAYRAQGWNLVALSTQGGATTLHYDGIFRPLAKSEIRTKAMSASAFQQQQQANAAAGWNIETFVRHW